MNLNIIIIAQIQMSAFYGINVRIASIKTSINQTKYQTKMINSIKKTKVYKKNKITNIFRQTNNKPKNNVKSKKLYANSCMSCRCPVTVQITTVGLWRWVRARQLPKTHCQWVLQMHMLGKKTSFKLCTGQKSIVIAL